MIYIFLYKIQNRNISNKGIKGSLPSDFENLGSLVEL